MNVYQEDLLEIYNSMTIFDVNLPVIVKYNDDLKSISMEQRGISVNLPLLNHYCLDIEKIKRTVLLSKDFDKLMSRMEKLIKSSMMNYDRLLISPKKYGFSIYRRTNSIQYSPIKIEDFEFISSNGFFFRLLVNFKYRKLLKWIQ